MSLLHHARAHLHGSLVRSSKSATSCSSLARVSVITMCLGPLRGGEQCSALYERCLTAETAQAHAVTRRHEVQAPHRRHRAGTGSCMQWGTACLASAVIKGRLISVVAVELSSHLAFSLACTEAGRGDERQHGSARKLQCTYVC
jgi:hypothetical protein